jgi:hypothetical protein
MQTLLGRLFLFGALAWSGCAHQHHEGHAGHEQAGHSEHPEMTGAVKALHETLSPVYHLEKGADRDAQACSALPKLEEGGKAVAAELSGESHKSKHETMTQALAGLSAACQATDRAEVAAKLELVHDAFHLYVAP